MTTMQAKRLMTPLLAMAFCAAATAQSSPWTLQLASSADAAGLRPSLVLPVGLGTSGSLDASRGGTVAGELAYSASPDWAAHLVVAAASSASNEAGMASFQNPSIRSVQGGIGVFASHRFASMGKYRPYASAGVVYESPLAGFQASGPRGSASSSWGLAMQAGFKAPKNEAWRLLLDLKRQQRLAEADGRQRTLQWSPARIALRLSPLRISAGTSLQF